MLRYIGSLILVLMLPCTVFATERTADTCGRQDVLDEINLSSDGDTVQIPAGDCTWTSTIAIPQTLSVSIIGAGVGTTWIDLNGTNFTFDIQPSVGEFVRISNMELTCGVSVTPGAAGINTKVQDGFRVDHILIDHSTRGNTTCSGTGLLGDLQAWTYGVFDNITAELASANGIILGGFVFQSNDSAGMDVWYEDAGWGGKDFVFIEDSTINNNGAGEAAPGTFDGRWGLKLVIRYNSFLNVDWGWHDNHATNSTAGRAQELYENDVQISSPIQRKWNQGHRGGNFYVWNNRVAIHDVSSQIIMVTYNRSTGAQGEWGTCDSSAEKFCVYPSAPIGEVHPGGTAPTVDGDCDTGGKAVQVDSQVDADGWVCRNQTGSGKTHRTTGVQDLEPSYAWDNLFCEDGAGGVCTPDTPFTIDIIGAEMHANRDVYNENGSPGGYNPYTYPHPLRGESASVSHHLGSFSGGGSFQ